MSYFKWGKNEEDQMINEIDSNYGVDLDKIHYDEHLNKTTNEEQYKYGDYEILRKPTVGVSGSGIIISSDNQDGIPNIDDYIVQPDGTKTSPDMVGVRYLKEFLSDDQTGNNTDGNKI